MKAWPGLLGELANVPSLRDDAGPSLKHGESHISAPIRTMTVVNLASWCLVGVPPYLGVET